MLSQRKAGAILGYANIIVKNLVNLVYTPMLLVFVGQADYGVFQTANSFVFSLTILSFGFSQAYIRFYTQKKVHGTRADIRTLNGMYLLLYVGICVLALVLGLVFAANVDVFFSGSFTPEQVGLAGQLMSIMAVNVSLTLFSTVFDAYILAHEQFKFQQTRQLFTTLATPVFAFILLELGMGALGVAAAQLAVYVVLLVLNARFAIFKLGMRFSFKTFDKKLFCAIAAFSAWIFANQVCELANQNLPNIILAASSSAMAVAVFAISIQIRSVFYSISTIISNVFIPEINRIVAETDDNNALTFLMAKVGRYQAILYMWLYGGFALLGHFFIAKWAGAGFEDAYWLILVMTTPLFIPLVQNTGIEIQRAKNKHKARSICYLLMAAVNVCLTAIFAPCIGYWAPVVGYVSYVIFGCGVFMNLYYHKSIQLNMFYFWKRVLPVVGVGVVGMGICFLGTHFMPVTSWLMFVVDGIVFSIIYALLLWILILTAQERAAVKLKLWHVN